MSWGLQRGAGSVSASPPASGVGTHLFVDFTVDEPVALPRQTVEEGPAQVKAFTRFLAEHTKTPDESWASIGRRIAWAQEDPPPLIAGGNEDEHFETGGGVPRWRGGLREHQLSPCPQVFRAWRWVASGPADG